LTFLVFFWHFWYFFDIFSIFSTFLVFFRHFGFRHSNISPRTRCIVVTINKASFSDLETVLRSWVTTPALYKLTKQQIANVLDQVSILPKVTNIVLQILARQHFAGTTLIGINSNFFGWQIFRRTYYMKVDKTCFMFINSS
jgi:hypothetical protein